MNHWLLRLAFRLAIALYPTGFRVHYGEDMKVFIDDLIADRTQGSGWHGVLHLWFVALPDTLFQGVKENIETMKEKLSPAVVLGGVALVLPALFVLENVLYYELNVALPFRLFGSPAWESLPSLVSDVLIIGGVALGVLLTAWPLGRDAVQSRASGNLNVGVLLRAYPISSGVLILGLLVLMAITLYLFAENWPCLTGVAPSC